MGIFETLRQIRMAGLGPALRTLRYTLKRDQMNARSKAEAGQAHGPGKLLSTQAMKQGMRAHFEQADLELYFLAPELVRVSWKPGLPPLPYALVEAQWPTFDVQCNSIGDGDACSETLETEALRVQAGVNGDLSFFKAGEEQPFRVDKAPIWQGKACSQSTRLPSPSGFFGLGEQAASLERCGRAYEMWNSDPRGKYGPGHDPLYTGIPLYLVLQPEACQLVFYENSYRGTFRFDKGDAQQFQAEVAFEGGMLRYYLITGSLAQVYERYSQLSGRPPLPPRWALGYHQCRWGYKSADEIRRVVEGFKEHLPDRRPWILSRSGWAGIQRYAWSWTGDVETSWPALQLTISTVLGFGLSGQPYCGPDIGGFSGDPSAELYLRWLQLAVFLPFCRTHSATGTARREPWVFGEPITSIVRDFLGLRYRLMPLLYTLAWQASLRGIPIVRPLFWLDPGDPKLWSVEDVFSLGDSLLVAPVLEAGARNRTVRLPMGDWYTFWEGNCLQGPCQVQLPAPLERIPLLVKAGSLLPMSAGDNLELHVYPPTTNLETETILYSDAGDGYGPARMDHFSLAWEGNRLLLERQSSGDFPFPYPEIQIVVHGIKLSNAKVDGQEISVTGDTIRSAPFQQAVLQLEQKPA